MNPMYYNGNYGAVPEGQGHYQVPLYPSQHNQETGYKVQHASQYTQPPPLYPGNGVHYQMPLYMQQGGYPFHPPHQHFQSRFVGSNPMRRPPTPPASPNVGQFSMGPLPVPSPPTPARVTNFNPLIPLPPRLKALAEIYATNEINKDNDQPVDFRQLASQHGIDVRTPLKHVNTGTQGRRADVHNADSYQDGIENIEPQSEQWQFPVESKPIDFKSDSHVYKEKSFSGSRSRRSEANDENQENIPVQMVREEISSEFGDKFVSRGIGVAGVKQSKDVQWDYGAACKSGGNNKVLGEKVINTDIEQLTDLKHEGINGQRILFEHSKGNNTPESNEKPEMIIDKVVEQENSISNIGQLEDSWQTAHGDSFEIEIEEHEFMTSPGKRHSPIDSDCDSTDGEDYADGGTDGIEHVNSNNLIEQSPLKLNTQRYNSDIEDIERLASVLVKEAISKAVSFLAAEQGICVNKGIGLGDETKVYSKNIEVKKQCVVDSKNEKNNTNNCNKSSVVAPEVWEVLELCHEPVSQVDSGNITNNCLWEEEAVEPRPRLYSWSYSDKTGGENVPEEEQDVKDKIQTLSSEEASMKKQNEDFEKFYFKQRASKCGISITSPVKGDNRTTIPAENPNTVSKTTAGSSHLANERNGCTSEGKRNTQRTEEWDFTPSKPDKSYLNRQFNKSQSEDSGSDVCSLQGSQSDPVEDFKVKASRRGIQIVDPNDSMDVTTESDLDSDLGPTQRSRSDTLDSIKGRRASTPVSSVKSLNPDVPEFKVIPASTLDSSEHVRYAVENNGPILNPESPVFLPRRKKDKHPSDWTGHASTESDLDLSSSDVSMRAEAPEFFPGRAKNPSVGESPPVTKPKARIFHLTTPKVDQGNPSVAIQASPTFKTTCVGTKHVRTREFATSTVSCDTREVAINTGGDTEDERFVRLRSQKKMVAKSTGTEIVRKRSVGINVKCKIPTKHVDRKDASTMVEKMEGCAGMDKIYLANKVKDLQVELMALKEREIVYKLTRQKDELKKQADELSLFFNAKSDESAIFNGLIMNKLSVIERTISLIQLEAQRTILQINSYSGVILDQLPDLGYFLEPIGNLQSIHSSTTTSTSPTAHSQSRPASLLPNPPTVTGTPIRYKPVSYPSVPNSNVGILNVNKSPVRQASQGVMCMSTKLSSPARNSHTSPMRLPVVPEYVPDVERNGSVQLDSEGLVKTKVPASIKDLPDIRVTDGTGKQTVGQENTESVNGNDTGSVKDCIAQIMKAAYSLNEIGIGSKPDEIPVSESKSASKFVDSIDSDEETMTAKDKHLEVNGKNQPTAETSLCNVMAEDTPPDVIATVESKSIKTSKVEETTDVAHEKDGKMPIEDIAAPEGKGGSLNELEESSDNETEDEDYTSCAEEGGKSEIGNSLNASTSQTDAKVTKDLIRHSPEEEAMSQQDNNSNTKDLSETQSVSSEENITESSKELSEIPQEIASSTNMRNEDKETGVPGTEQTKVNQNSQESVDGLVSKEDSKSSIENSIRTSNTEKEVILALPSSPDLMPENMTQLPTKMNVSENAQNPNLVPENMTQLPTKLNVSENAQSVVPENMTQLPTKLNVSENAQSVVPENMTQLPTKLNVSENAQSIVPENMTQLPTKLNMSENAQSLNLVPENMTQLPTKLNVSENAQSVVPENMTQLPTKLNVSENAQSVVPENMTQLPTKLNVSENAQSVVPENMTQLPTKLNVSENAQSIVPENMTQLPTKLNMSENAQSIVPENMTQLPTKLNMSENAQLHSSMDKVPEDMTQLPSNMNIVPENKIQLPSSMNIVPENMTQLPPNMDIVPEDKIQLPSSMNIVPENMTQLPPNMDIVPEDKIQLPSSMNIVSENITPLLSNMYRVPENMTQSPLNMNMMPKNMTQLPPNMNTMPQMGTQLRPRLNIIPINRYQLPPSQNMVPVNMTQIHPHVNMVPGMGTQLRPHLNIIPGNLTQLPRQGVNMFPGIVAPPPPSPMPLMRDIDPALFQAVMGQLIQAYPQMMGDQVMLTNVAMQQTHLLQMYMKGQGEGQTQGQESAPGSLPSLMNVPGAAGCISNTSLNMQMSEVTALTTSSNGQNCPLLEDVNSVRADGVQFQSLSPAVVTSTHSSLHPVTTMDEGLGRSKSRSPGKETSPCGTLNPGRTIDVELGRYQSIGGAMVTSSPSPSHPATTIDIGLGRSKSQSLSMATASHSPMSFSPNLSSTCTTTSSTLYTGTTSSTSEIHQSGHKGMLYNNNDYSVKNKEEMHAQENVSVVGNKESHKNHDSSSMRMYGNMETAYTNSNQRLQPPRMKHHFIADGDDNGLNLGESMKNTGFSIMCNDPPKEGAVKNTGFSVMCSGPLKEINKDSTSKKNEVTPIFSNQEKGKKEDGGAAKKHSFKLPSPTQTDFLPDFAKKHNPHNMNTHVVEKLVNRLDDQVIRSINNSDSVHFTRRTPSPRINAEPSNVFALQGSGFPTLPNTSTQKESSKSLQFNRNVPPRFAKKPQGTGNVYVPPPRQQESYPQCITQNEDWDAEADQYPSTFTLQVNPRSKLMMKRKSDVPSDVLQSVTKPTVKAQVPTFDITKKDLTFDDKQKGTKKASPPAFAPLGSSGGLSDIPDIQDPKVKKEDNVEKAVEGEEEEKEEEWCEVKNRKRYKSQEQPVKRVSQTSTMMRKQQTENQKATKTTNFDKLINRLKEEFPDSNRQAIIDVVSKIRAQRGSLSGLTMEKIVESAHFYIEKPKKYIPGLTVPPGSSASKNVLNIPRFAKSAANQNSNSGPPVHQSAHAPKSVLELPTFTPPSLINKPILIDDEEEICVICHDGLSMMETKELDCRHIFHYKCIGQWVERERTCPTCRKHALFPEDFPRLGK